MTPVPTDFDMFGLKRLQWQQLLSCDSTIRTALTYDPETESAQRQYKLNQVRKEELMYALRQLKDPDQQQDIYKGKCYADFLTVQISDGNGTVNEQMAICAAVHRTDLKCISAEDGQDLGYGIFRLSKPRKNCHLAWIRQGVSLPGRTISRASPGRISRVSHGIS